MKIKKLSDLAEIPATWTVTIHRFQPKTGKTRNQAFTLAGTSDDALPPTMSLGFGETADVVHDDLVARTHAVTRIIIDSQHSEVHIFSAPTSIRPYTEKVPKDHSKITKLIFEPADIERYVDESDSTDQIQSPPPADVMEPNPLTITDEELGI